MPQPDPRLNLTGQGYRAHPLARTETFGAESKADGSALPHLDVEMLRRGQFFEMIDRSEGSLGFEQRSSVERSQRLDAQRGTSSLGAPVQGIGEVATAALLQQFSSDAAALGFYQQEVAPQFDAVPVDLVARFAVLERREDRVCKVAPSNPQQFRQPVDAAGQSFQLDHLRISFKMSKAAFLER